MIAQAREAPPGSIDIGKLLRAYRVREDFTQQELADKMGTTQVAVAYLETGKENITPQRVIHIAQALGLSEAEGKIFRDHVISQELALIAQAYEAPPGSINVNSLLKAYRIRASLTQQELAERMGTTRSAVLWWETGAKSFSNEQISLFEQAVGLSAEDRKTLRNHVIIKEQSAPTSSMDVGSLLRACRERANLTQQKLADKMGIPPSEISRWEHGTLVALRKHVDSFAQIVELSDEEREHLRSLVIPVQMTLIATAHNARRGTIPPGELSKAYRIRKGITRSRLAEITDLPPEFIKGLENGSKAFSESAATQITRALELPYEDADAFLRQALRREPTLQELTDVTGRAPSDIMRTEIAKQREIFKSIHRREISEGEEQSDTRWTDKIKKEGNTKGSPLL